MKIGGQPRITQVIAGLLFTACLLVSCIRPWPGSENWVPPTYVPVANTGTPEATRFFFLPPTRQPGAPILTPTPDAPHILPTLRSDIELYIVQPNDTLGLIAQRYGVDLN
ncbi:MAG: LysM peptidoglycan-binding domain-containing protein, partial [Planctomycetes bacterium]|nr:LysM peptidoglycan-binding domain-containing protein [Planctomycetota bacterium]